MKKVIKKSFDILIKNSAMMQPLIFYILIMLFFTMYMASRAFSSVQISLAFGILMLLLFTAFLAGWFNTIKYAIDNYKEFNKNDEDYAMQVARYNLDTGKNFFNGVGEYFAPVLVVVLVYFVVSFLIFIFGFYIFKIDNLTIDILKNSSAMVDYAQKNPKFIYYLTFVIGAVQFLQFLIMFWLPKIYYETQNPFKAFFSSISFEFKNFWYSIGLYLFIVLTSIIFNILGTLFNQFYILSLIFMIISLYYVNYIFVLIFNGYKSKFLQIEVEKMNSKDVFIKSSEVRVSDGDKEE